MMLVVDWMERFGWTYIHIAHHSVTISHVHTAVVAVVHNSSYLKLMFCLKVSSIDYKGSMTSIAFSPGGWIDVVLHLPNCIKQKG